jgi:hypothetical protein
VYANVQRSSTSCTSNSQDSTMTSVPYPAFVSQLPIDASQNRAGLTAVGRCRILPQALAEDEYRAVVAKNVDQFQVDVDNCMDDTDKEAAKKKLKKKYMKEGVAMAKIFLMKTLQLDVSVVDVEVVVDPADLVATDGCLAACLLDAGCSTVVTDGTNLNAMDAAKIPRERLAAHFRQDNSNNSISNLMEAFKTASPLASSVSVEMNHDSSLDTILAILSHASTLENLEIVIQFAPSTDEAELESTMAEISSKAPKGRICLVDPTARQLGLGYAAYIRTDRDDRLYTTVVCTRSGEALGLVYSSKVRSASVSWKETLWYLRVRFCLACSKK